MYHYVRPDNKDYPYLKSLNLEIFKRQLDYFEKMFGFLTKDEYQDAIKKKKNPKGAVLTFTKTIAIELAKFNITANCISPGPLLTEINKVVLDDKENYRKFCEKIPVGRFGETNEILTSVAFLASRYSSYVTGADIKVDGGWTIY